MKVEPFVKELTITRNQISNKHGKVTFIPSSTRPTGFGLAVFETANHGFQVAGYSLNGSNLTVSLSQAEPLIVAGNPGDKKDTVLYDSMAGTVKDLDPSGKFSSVTGGVTESSGQVGESDTWDASGEGGGEEVPPHHYAVRA